MDWNEFSQKLNDKMDKTFKPNKQWMAEKYQEMNQWLFGGKLGECNFDIFTTGRGSQGGTLGWFKITGRGISVNRYTRRMSYRINDGVSLRGGDVTRENFYSVCKPQIELNGNYSGTEHAFLATLVHEMCHYYTYMNGYAPKQGHGSEFKSIGLAVSERSQGMFTIQRLASAEQMIEYELSDEMKAKRAKRLANKKSSVTAILVFTKDGKVKLTITSNQRLIDTIKTTEEQRGENVVTTNDADVIEFLFSKGYRKNMRTWRYWSLEEKPWLGELKAMLPETSGQMLSIGRPAAQQVAPQQSPKQPKKIFSIKTSSGIFEYPANPIENLVAALRQKFPNMKGDAMMKIIDNQANYRMVENKENIKSIVESVIQEFMRNEFRGANNMDDSVEITPDMNLGEFSPLEL